MITYNVSGTVTIVTCAASGISLATAGAAARAGRTVLLNDMPGVVLETAVASLKSGGLAVHPCPADQSDSEAVVWAVDGIVALAGKITYLVNKAATPGTPLSANFS